MSRVLDAGQECGSPHLALLTMSPLLPSHKTSDQHPGTALEPQQAILELVLWLLGLEVQGESRWSGYPEVFPDKALGRR